MGLTTRAGRGYTRLSTKHRPRSIEAKACQPAKSSPSSATAPDDGLLLGHWCAVSAQARPTDRRLVAREPAQSARPLRPRAGSGLLSHRRHAHGKHEDAPEMAAVDEQAT